MTHTILIDDALALDDERMTELASEFPATLKRVGEAHLRLDARFVLARGDVERLSAIGSGKARYRISFYVSFLPPARGRFAHAHLVLGLDAHSDIDILSIRPVEQSGAVEIETEETSGGETSIKYKGIGSKTTHDVKKVYKTVPITIRGIGPGSDAAEWTLDGPPEEGGLPATVDLGIDVALSGPRLVADVRMTAGVRWEGILGILPFAWPKGSLGRIVVIDLPAT